MKTVLDYYTTIENYPAEGILFRDVTSVLNDAEGLQLATDEMLARINPDDIDVIMGIEARGFFFAPTLAYFLKKPFVPVRKAGKLPRETVCAEYDLEYGSAKLEIHRDSICSGARVLVVDDLIATGGTAKATAQMIEALGGTVAGFLFLAELSYLDGRDMLAGYKVESVIRF